MNICAVAWLVLAVARGPQDDPPVVSHPPLHPLRAPAHRPLEKGPSYFVDSGKGSDAGPGTEAAPWRTLGHAMMKLVAGDTLVLRKGIFHENVYCSVVGRKDAPVTIRSYPGERVILDGGFEEFLARPGEAWVPFDGGAPGEFRSAKRYPNIRDVVGLFGDSNIGLQTYWHAMDLRSSNELDIDDPEKKLMSLPLYCGPGLWYDKESAYIHVRLAHTGVQKHIGLPTPQVSDYAGETDPRKVPLVIAPFKSVPLFVDQAMHVRFQDLILRGGGYNTTVLQFGVDLDFDNVTIFAGTYGIRARNTGPLRFFHSAVYGMNMPWAWRTENSLYTFHPRLQDPFVPAVPVDASLPGSAKGGKAAIVNERNIARLPTHALVVTEGAEDSSVFAYPFNHDWEVAYSEFADAHDGVYLAGNTMRFHHNWVDNMQDDSIYLSSPTNYISDNVWVYQNLITRTVTAFSWHSRGGPSGNVYVLRNVVDLRMGACFERATPTRKGKVQGGNVFFMHGRDFLGVESIYFYHNTAVSPLSSHAYAHRFPQNVDGKSARHVFNNLCVYLNGYPNTYIEAKKGSDIRIDGNLHWCADAAAKVPAGFLDAVRRHPLSEENRKTYPPGWEAHSLVADPKFLSFGSSPLARNDYRLAADSPARRAGVVLPRELEDPLRPRDDGRPDIGALPADGEPLRVGVQGRVTAGISGLLRD